MGDEMYTCSDCGQRYHEKCEHHCPGGFEDHDNRLRRLEERIDDLEEEVRKLREEGGKA